MYVYVCIYRNVCMYKDTNKDIDTSISMNMDKDRGKSRNTDLDEELDLDLDVDVDIRAACQEEGRAQSYCLPELKVAGRG